MLITLPDGRSLDIEVSGPSDGVPLVFHHGTPGCVLPYPPMAQACADRGLRLVTYSRAGYGYSTRRPGRRVVDIAEDVVAILDHLGASRCLTAGWSGGGPHALATAAVLPDRVLGALAIAPVAPYDAAGLDFLAGMGEQNIVEFGWALEGEDRIREPAEKEAAEYAHLDLEGLITAMDTLLPEVDRAVLRAGMGQWLLDQMQGAFVVGADGWIDDDLVFVEPWGIDLGAITVPTFLWQGAHDLMVPYAHGQWLATAIAGVTAHLHDDEGHLSLIGHHLDAMLDQLVAVL